MLSTSHNALKIYIIHSHIGKGPKKKKNCTGTLYSWKTIVTNIFHFVYIIVLLVTIEMGIKCPKTNSVSHISKVRKKNKSATQQNCHTSSKKKWL